MKMAQDASIVSGSAMTLATLHPPPTSHVLRVQAEQHDLVCDHGNACYFHMLASGKCRVACTFHMGCLEYVLM